MVQAPLVPMHLGLLLQLTAITPLHTAVCLTDRCVLFKYLFKEYDVLLTVCHFVSQ
jgi:hypothetical protein